MSEEKQKRIEEAYKKFNQAVDADLTGDIEACLKFVLGMCKDEIDQESWNVFCQIQRKTVRCAFGQGFYIAMALRWSNPDALLKFMKLTDAAYWSANAPSNLLLNPPAAKQGE